MPDDKQDKEHGIVPATGASFDMQKDVAIPTSYSAGGWTHNNEGLEQQTFLGASIRDFTMNAGFNNTSSTLSMNLVADEYNVSDKTLQGFGDDVYHSGNGDAFLPPAVGSPVFFKFGKNHATVEEVFRAVYDSTYINPNTGKNYNTIPLTPARIRASRQKKRDGQGGISQVDGIVDPEVFFSGVPSEQGKYYANDPILSTTDPTAANQWVDDKVALNSNIRGRDHIAFGGILQAYTQNRGGAGNPVYAVSLTDPRELLGNVELILGNYTGSTFNNANMLNIFGFLEHNPSAALRAALEGYYDNPIGNGMGGQVQTIGVPPKRIQPVFFTDPRPLVGGYPKGGEVDRIVNYVTGEISYVGDDLWCKSYVYPTAYIQNPGITDGLPRTEFPITGTGFSRRNEEGIPVYRVVQAMKALMNYDGKTPEEYGIAGYGGPINFRGYNYIVDLTGLPLDKVSKFYRLNYEKMTLLDFCQEICEITSHEMFVSLLPVIDHPAVGFVSDYNNFLTSTKPAGWKTKMVEGVIRVEGISKTDKPKYGTIKAFIDKLTLSDNNVRNSDVGFELSNVVTDKFVVGAQEVKMYYFSDNRDRDHLDVRRAVAGLPNNANGLLADQWYHWKSLQQQILPFYGFLGKEAVTIPRGWGSFQQILLDASACDAVGVGSYYVATELELRAAAVSYERWSQFLLRYNSEYMSSMEPGDALEESLLSTTVAPSGTLPSGTVPLDPKISQNFGVSVPRCVFMSDKDFMTSDNLPASPCSPPFGYPLYYKRAEKIGIPEAGIVKVMNSINSIITNLGTLKGKFKDGQQAEQINMGEFTAMKNMIVKEVQAHMNTFGTKLATQAHKAGLQIFVEKLSGDVKPSNISKLIEELKGWAEKVGLTVNEKTMEMIDEATGEIVTTVNKNQALADQIGFLKEKINNNVGLIRNRNKMSKLSLDNARKVYNFVKSVADKHLGKTFLVKVPSDTNLTYTDCPIYKPAGNKTNFIAQVQSGPFGFKPEPVNFEFGHYFSQAFQSQMISLAAGHTEPFNFIRAGTRPNSRTGPRQKPQFGDGALKSSYNSIDSKWSFNYMPHPEGGYLDYTQMPQTNSFGDIRKSIEKVGVGFLPPSVRCNLFPVDPSNFIDENGRMKAYVRYDNSQYLNFQGVSPQRMSQQVLSFGGKFIPDILEQLDNIKSDKFTSFGSKGRLQGHRQRRSVAFIQVDMDAKFYMPPRSDVHVASVFGRVAKDIGALVKPKIIFDNKTCEFKPSYSFYRSHFVPAVNGGKMGSTKIVEFLRVPTPLGRIIVTDPVNLDGDNVYALITIPGSVKSTIDSRYADGPMQNFNPSDIKNLLTMDTVKIPEFRTPTVKGNPTSIAEDLCGAGQLGVSQIATAIKSVRDGFKHVSMASPERSLQYHTSSPIYPNLVVLPLLSKERCYGPWVSSSYNAGNPMSPSYVGIGGKIEYSKDEELAPWNYGGFDILNAVGHTKASMSNSELLMSERGGIVFAGIPKNDLGKSLDSVGPLVTSISVNISPGGVETTYKMDLYTPKFGRLQGQREAALQKFGRNRQQQIDEQNRAMRGALKKGMTGSVNISNELSKYNDLIEASKSSSEFLSDFEKSSTYNDMILGSVNLSETTTHDGKGNPITHPTIDYDVTLTPEKNHMEAMSVMPAKVLAGKQTDTAGGSIKGTWVPSNQGVDTPGMASRGYYPENNYQDHFYAKDNAGQTLTPQPGLPTANGFRNSSKIPSGGTKGGTGVVNPDLSDNGFNSDIGSGDERSAMGDLMGGGFGGDRATSGGGSF